MENKLANEEWMGDAPEGYFDSLSERIRQSVFLEELRSKVAEGGFTTPENYFDELPEVIQGNVFVERLKGTEAVERAGFSVPEGYFEQLQSKIALQAASEIALQTDSKTAPWNASNPNIGDQMASDQFMKTADEPVKTVKLWGSGFLKYASAACFILLSAAGLYFYQQKPEEVINYAELANEQMLYDIDEHVIIEHIQSASMEEQAPAVENAELENYILTNYSQDDIASDL